MKFQGAVIKEQGVTFAIVVVKKHVLDSPHQSEEAISSFMPLFPHMPIVLMAQDQRGVASYRGRRDITNFLVNIHVSQIPWREYTFG
ncbi:hypothetical protein A5320_16455 [Rheinheimera sp. SA_1]|jgi:hypothetical protein|uniref:hypothetical protein n=1 Tax=Rheinheimera sp. SA_1 TaxID=1827365 RepID=UPI0007FCABB7|nr:hypothetical protein [Rheinheimera sp. SA_1]OBP14225.1 hypothetical protein A5320_16455 [Rheinheimera sp. SA_1]